MKGLFQRLTGQHTPPEGVKPEHEQPKGDVNINVNVNVTDSPEDNDALPLEARVEKLEEAERWTARKRQEMDAVRREYARYELELELETGRRHAQPPASRRHRWDDASGDGERRNSSGKGADGREYDGPERRRS
jgi:hypothetical protein